MGVNRSELKYLVGAVLFAFVLFSYLIPWFVGKGFDNSSPYLQFFIFNIGIFIFLQIFLKAATLSSKINILGSLGVITLFMALDILIPPMMVSFSGQLLSGPVLSHSATDYVAGVLGQSMGLSGFFLYTFVYVVCPFILLFISAKLLPNFVRKV